MRWLQIGALFVLAVNGFFVAVWALSPLDARLASSIGAADFWPGWIMLLTGIPLALGALYVAARRPVAEPGGRRGRRAGRRMATVLFTDLVRSTERATQSGDRLWGQMLDRHDRLVSEIVSGNGGTVIKSTGDASSPPSMRPARPSGQRSRFGIGLGPWIWRCVPASTPGRSIFEGEEMTSAE